MKIMMFNQIGLIAILQPFSPTSSVQLAWDSNPEPDIAGYYMYRKDTLEGNFVRLNTTPIEGTTYTDDLPGIEVPECGPDPTSSFSYVVTAVDDTGLESGFSNQVDVQREINIPPCPPTGLVEVPNGGNRATLSVNPVQRAQLYEWWGIKHNGRRERLGQSQGNTFTFKKRGYKKATSRVLIDDMWSNFAKEIILR